MIKAYQKFWKNYVNFSGRCRRSDFWWAMLCQYIIMLVLYVLLFSQMKVSAYGSTSYTTFGWIIWAVLMIFALASILPSIALVLRRLHDIGKTGWWYFIACVPCAGTIVLLIFFCTEGNPGPNQYGEDPKATV